ncbi:MAG TPA: hypothetical protein VH306_07050 [Gaiellaceae bacterium]|jgi:hypothetical protein
MTVTTGIVLLVLAAIVILAPLGREYADLRRSFRLGRIAALGTTLLVVPSLAIGFALALPLSSRPALQWTTTVVVALLSYSLFAAAVRSAAKPAEARRRG